MLSSSVYVVRVRTLQTLKQHQLQELELMEQEKIKLKQKAEQLAEKYEDTKDKQEELTKRQDMDCRSNFLVVSEASQGTHHMTVSALCLNFLQLFGISEEYIC